MINIVYSADLRIVHHRKTVARRNRVQASCVSAFPISSGMTVGHYVEFRRQKKQPRGGSKVAPDQKCNAKQITGNTEIEDWVVTMIWQRYSKVTFVWPASHFEPADLISLRRRKQEFQLSCPLRSEEKERVSFWQLSSSRLLGLVSSRS